MLCCIWDACLLIVCFVSWFYWMKLNDNMWRDKWSKNTGKLSMIGQFYMPCMWYSCYWILLRQEGFGFFCLSGGRDYWLFDVLGSNPTAHNVCTLDHVLLWTAGYCTQGSACRAPTRCSLHLFGVSSLQLLCCKLDFYTSENVSPVWGYSEQ